MRIVRTVAELRAALAGRAAAPAAAEATGAVAAEAGPAEAGTIGFVPTMGALHEGHLSLVRAARAVHATVVLSIFVNPTQFDEQSDFARYTRDEGRDAELAAAAGVDVLFAPEVAEVYPEGFSTSVSVGGRLTEVLEGAERGRGHFDGVATVVAKLLIAVGPETAYFGEKDYQQLLVVRRLVADLGLPVRIVGCPTSREADGLARSSRNARLTAEERRRAGAIPRALAAIAERTRHGAADPEPLRAEALRELAAEGVEVEYLAFVDPDSLEAVADLASPVLLAVAARIGDVRLIDNRLLSAAAPAVPGAPVAPATPATPATPPEQKR